MRYRMVAHNKLLVVGLAGALLASAGRGQSPQTPSAGTAAAQAAKSAPAPYRNQPVRISNREAAVLDAVWGIESPVVKAVESGLIIKFSYRVLDPQKAKVLSDKKFTPYLESEDKGLQLVIPTMEKVGQLRQAPHDIVPGETYWMGFSNPGRQIKPGDHVDVTIGNFHVRDLVVE
ncbi:hypothetical protein DYQ86_01120 [Acidobacteria bacterium AB60]|nr:hypothetical protein DYQ86_01120 [Acidobacteria bacterium AB60]